MSTIALSGLGLSRDTVSIVSSEIPQSEDWLIFGTIPSHFFDELALTLDNLLTEEISALPLLPRSPNEHNSHKLIATSVGKNPASNLSGEEILLAKLREVYQKNLDLVEAYCLRNVFTIQHFPKTKRRKVLENFLQEEREMTDTSSRKETTSAPLHEGRSSMTDLTLPRSKFEAPATIEEIPNAEQIVAMDRKILVARQGLHREKQRRVRLVRQLERLKESLEAIREVTQAFAESEVVGIQDKIQKVLQRHQELKVWNARAEDVIHRLDKIKDERLWKDDCEEKGDIKAQQKNITREVDERKRKKVWMEMNGRVYDSAAFNGTTSFLKKLKEK